jgi:hypothetical protein
LSTTLSPFIGPSRFDPRHVYWGRHYHPDWFSIFVYVKVYVKPVCWD